MSKLEDKYPLQFERARLLVSRELNRGLEFYKNGGRFTANNYINVASER